MRTRLIVVVASLGGVLAAAVPVSAHHSFAAEYDANKPLKLTGTVTKIEWTNPHCFFYIDVKNETGTVETWAFELGNPNALLRNGWTPNSVKIGDEVTIEGTRAKDGTLLGNARAMVLASTGRRLFAGSSQTTSP
jgi:DNA/RNA endonuclease YhcR with UshA esterase domain